MPLAPPINFSFAIITNWDDGSRITEMVDNINLRAGAERKIDILVIGGQPVTVQNEFKRVRYIPAVGEWICTKKNTAAWIAKYNNIVVMHDYFLLDPYWFEGFEEFGEDWDICSNPQKLMDGSRHFTDWVVWDHPIIPRYSSLDYWDHSHTQHQYISGGYFAVKRRVLIDNPFSPVMGPGMPEDVEWSLRVRAKYKIKCNPYSSVTHNKVHRDMKVRNYDS